MLDRWLLPLRVMMPVQVGVDGGPWWQVFLSLLLMPWYRRCWPAFLRWPGTHLKAVRTVHSLTAHHHNGHSHTHFSCSSGSASNYCTRCSKALAIHRRNCTPFCIALHPGAQLLLPMARGLTAGAGAALV